MLEIMTERCCLRPMTDADFPALCRYLQDPGVMYAYGMPSVTGKSGTGCGASRPAMWCRDTVPWPWSCGKRAK